MKFAPIAQTAFMTLLIGSSLMGCSRFDIDSSVVTAVKSSKYPGSTPPGHTSTPTPAPGATPVPSTPTPVPSEFANPTYKDFMNGYLTLQAGQSVSINGVSLQFTMGGNAQVTLADGSIAWQTGTQATCSASTCNLVLQSDGNFVAYGPNGAIWGSGTDNKGALLTLSSVAPYITIRDSNFTVIWPQAGIAGPSAMLAGLRSATSAASVSEFVHMLAVNSHLDQNGYSAQTELQMLNYLGISTIRDGYVPGTAATFQTLAQNGVHFNIVSGDPYASGFLANLESLAALAPGALESVEGPNEINNFPFVSQGVTSQTGWPNNDGPMVQSFMSKLFTSVHQDAALSGVSIYEYTWGGTTNPDQYGMFDIAGQADYGNIHFYPPGQPYRALQTSIAGAYHHVQGPQAVMTETGYDTKNMSQRAQAIMTLNLCLSAFQQGFKKIFLYELYDEWQTYGLFTGTFAPKMAATGLHNLTSILADSGSGTPASRTLNYQISGLPADTGHSVLLQKSNGVFELIVWNEAPVYANGADLPDTIVNLGVQFGQTVSKVSVYDPISGAAAIQQAGSSSSLSLQLKSQPLVIELTP